MDVGLSLHLLFVYLTPDLQISSIVVDHIEVIMTLSSKHVLNLNHFLGVDLEMFQDSKVPTLKLTNYWNAENCCKNIF